jgi:hypothetical protein
VHMFCHFMTFIHSDAKARLSSEDRARVATLIRRTTGLARAQLFTPAAARDRYIDDGPPPMLMLQLYFQRLEVLEDAAGADGTLQELAGAMPPSLADTAVTHQVMWARSFPTPAPLAWSSPERRSCSFLVHYPGEADDLNQWHAYYLQHHPQIMFRFPGIREIEIYTRVDWIDALPWQRVHYFQRNKIAFDSATALEQALHSPARQEMKSDRERFPPFSGGNVHHPMETETI